MIEILDGLDLPFIWAGILALAVFLYVVLDGFDLGIGILFPLARDDNERGVMMNAVAPVWDGNETWLVMGGAGLFAAFPKAYAALLPAFYMPIGFMLTALIFRGVAFEFRFKAGLRGRKFWDQAFHMGSIIAAFSQGIILGAFVQGIVYRQGQFAGQAFDWLTPFSMLTGVGVVFGYALLGSCWLVVKTQGDLLKWSRWVAMILVLCVLGFMAVVSIWMVMLNPGIAARWGLVWANGFWPNIDRQVFLPLCLVPVMALILGFGLIFSIRRKSVYLPYLCAVGLFALGYLGLGISFYPFLVPGHLTIWQAAAARNSQELLLIGMAIFLPFILIYTAYAYWVFRGKVADEGYH